jgi:hypothetical protein
MCAALRGHDLGQRREAKQDDKPDKPDNKKQQKPKHFYEIDGLHRKYLLDWFDTLTQDKQDDTGGQGHSTLKSSSRGDVTMCHEIASK